MRPSVEPLMPRTLARPGRKVATAVKSTSSVNAPRMISVSCATVSASKLSEGPVSAVSLALPAPFLEKRRAKSGRSKQRAT